jgi:hypothetical protein
MKGYIVRRILLLLVLVLMTACGGSQQGTPSQATSSAVTPAGEGAAITATVGKQAATDVPSATPTTSGDDPTSHEAATATTEASMVATGGPIEPGAVEFVNPVIDQDFPDPDVLKVGDTYYAYATNTSVVDVQVAKSTDLVHWQMLPDAVGALPGWAKPGLTWAPDVSLAGDGSTFILYFTARDKASDRQCVGVATSDKPEGPFKSDAQAPLICQTDLGGSIDPATFVDEDGER